MESLCKDPPESSTKEIGQPSLKTKREGNKNYNFFILHKPHSTTTNTLNLIKIKHYVKCTSKLQESSFYKHYVNCSSKTLERLNLYIVLHHSNHITLFNCNMPQVNCKNQASFNTTLIARLNTRKIRSFNSSMSQKPHYIVQSQHSSSKSQESSLHKNSWKSWTNQQTS